DFVITQPVASGETMTLTIPNQLKLINYGGFPLMDSQGNTIANATIDQATGTITLTFTDYVNTHTDLSGSLFYNATFNSKNIQTDQVNPIAFPVKNSTQTINAFISKVNTGGGTGSPTIVFKQGRMDDKDLSILHWTVTLNNALTPID
ncbi:cell surface protein, partial [Listeria monocytogenes]|nr:cell surface protein [Listeria monocytogenes]